MIDDGVKGEGIDEEDVRVADIAITVLEAIETGEEKREAAEFAQQVELADLSPQTPRGDISGGDVAVAVAEPEVEIQGFAATAPTDVVAQGVPAGAGASIEPDDLKVIKGIGPKLEALLHELGIVTYEQIAAFPADYIVKLDDYLAFDGRINRDNWVGQAQELAQTRPTKTADLPDLPDEQPENATTLD